MLDKELLRQIKNADEIIYISDNIQAELSGYSRTASGARGSTLNTQLHPSGSFIIKDSRRGGKDVAGGKGEGNAFPLWWRAQRASQQNCFYAI